jgi:hypothetical protein
MGNRQAKLEQEVDDIQGVNKTQDCRIRKLKSQQADLQSHQADLAAQIPQQLPKATFEQTLVDLKEKRTMWCADGGKCTFPKDTKSVDSRGDFKHTGTLNTSKLQLGDKFLLSGVGDGHGNDEWLRVFGKEGKDYYGGIAAGKGWFGNDVWLGGNASFGGGTNLKGGKSALNPNNWNSHFPWSGDGRNYIRGDTDLQGHLFNVGNVRVGGTLQADKDVNLAGRLHFKDPSFVGKPNDKNNSDPYYLEKVTAKGNESSLRLTINDDWDESLQIWGNSCGAGDCTGPGTMAHSFRADGKAFHAQGIDVLRPDPGPLIQKQYGEDKGNRYGIGQDVNGTLRMYSASSHAPATINLSMAKPDGGFRDIVKVGNDGVVRVDGTIKTNHAALANQNYPGGWGGGIHSWDIWANATIAAGRDGNVGSWMNADGLVGCKDLRIGRWAIRDENGILVFRDLQGSGDKRYAFLPDKSQTFSG